MKKLFFMVAMAFVSLAMVACGDDDDKENGTGTGNGGNTNATNTTYPVADIKVTGNIDVALGNQLIGAEATVSFPRFPANIGEFDQARDVLKQTPQGAVAVQLMAMELYRRNPKTGEAALKKCNTTTNISSMTSRLGELFGNGNNTNYKDPEYLRPYQVAAFLQGASPANGYNPSEPYTVRVAVGPSGVKYSENYQANIVYFTIFTEASDSGSRLGLDVVSTKKPGQPNDGWVVDNSPALVSQARAISYSATFNGLK